MFKCNSFMCFKFCLFCKNLIEKEVWCILGYYRISSWSTNVKQLVIFRRVDMYNQFSGQLYTMSVFWML